MRPDDSDNPMKGSFNTDKLTYLALGDSYTIGEGVSDSGRYSSQLIAKLNSETDKWSAPKVIARTGWTVDELAQGIARDEIEGETFDLVTLLIGVNNQYRGRPVENFKKEFEVMVISAISFAGEKSNHVVVISIPDWGITPFAKAKDMDESKVTREINTYNLACKTISEKHEVAYIDINEAYQEVGDQIEMLAADGLHPSAQMYGIWTKKLFAHVKSMY